MVKIFPVDSFIVLYCTIMRTGSSILIQMFFVYKQNKFHIIYKDKNYNIENINLYGRR